MSKKTAYKRRDGRWECRISMGKDENGRRVFRSFYGKSRDEAEYKAMIALDHSEDEYAVTEMTVRELVTEWLHVTASRIKESTAANYVMKAEKHLIPAFGEIKCCLLKAKDIYAFIERKIKEGLSVRYLSDIIVLFKSVFRYASREYRIRNVLDGIVLPKKNKPEIAVMNKKQQLRLEKYLDERPSVTSVGIAISMYMGLRIGEVCGLQWGDFDLSAGVLTIRRTVSRIYCRDGHTKVLIQTPKTRSSGREIPIPQELFTLLQRLHGGASEETWFLSGNAEKPVEPRCYRKSVQLYLRQAAVRKVHPHTLRHTFATTCLQAGCDIKTLSELLGHADPNITLRRYVHSNMNRKRRELERVFAAVWAVRIPLTVNMAGT